MVRAADNVVVRAPAPAKAVAADVMVAVEVLVVAGVTATVPVLGADVYALAVVKV
jgi:hypothetical protein